MFTTLISALHILVLVGVLAVAYGQEQLNEGTPNDPKTKHNH